MNLRQLDLNLLVVLDAIYSEGGITRAAVKLHLTQPAVTHALNRLRAAFDDPLFVRDGRAMVPTPVARNLIHPVKAALRGIEILLQDVNRFDPGSTPRRFTLGLRDVMEPTLLPRLQQRVQATAPQLELESIQTERRSLESELASGRLDVALDILLPLSEKVCRRRIHFDRLVVVVRQSHPVLRPGLDLERYLQQDHILATVRRHGGGSEDLELSRLGLRRRIRLRCQHYFAALEVVRQSDLVLTMPEGYARAANRQQEFQILPFPLEQPPRDGYLYWHANVDTDPANAWLRGQLLDAFTDAHQQQ